MGSLDWVDVGTSMDGIDAVLVSFQNNTVHIHASHTTPYPDQIRHRLLAASQNHAAPDEIGELDTLVGTLFAQAANDVIQTSGFDRATIRAIGSHGQTLRTPAFRHSTLLDPDWQSFRGIRSQQHYDGRRFPETDMAAGGQGAPLVPAFHKAFFSSETENRCILNLGGIANITWLPASTTAPATGFDTGPANALMDAWCLDQTGLPFDSDGHWAREGSVNEELLEDMLSDAYFSKAPPKSTGKERFNLDWVKTLVGRHPEIPTEDIQRTLLQLTVNSVVNQLPETKDVRIYVCGGGARNPLLMEELGKALPEASLSLTSELGVDLKWWRPVAFAWLAKQAFEGKPGNLPDVTGAAGPRILGAIYPA